MAAFAASLLHFVLKSVPSYASRTRPYFSGLNIPFPQVPHLVLSDELIDGYDEVVVIGDVHGCFDELTELLAQIHNNVTENSVLKLFVGDLVDKGPKSREVMQFILHNQFRGSYLPVRGNHDNEVLDQVLNVVRKDIENLSPRHRWMEDINEEESDFLSQLPYTITIPSLKAIIVHAGLIPGVPVREMAPSDLVEMRNVVKEGNGYKANHTHREGVAWASVWPGPEHVYFGHDAKRKLQKEKFATGLDTGCVYGNELTGLFIKGKRKGQFIHVKAKKAYLNVKK